MEKIKKKYIPYTCIITRSGFTYQNCQIELSILTIFLQPTNIFARLHYKSSRHHKVVGMQLGLGEKNVWTN